MGQLSQYIPFLLASLVGLHVWLIKRSFEQETNYKLLKQTVEFYLEQSGKGAALGLNKPNPAPEHIRPLLDDYVNDKLVEPGRETLLTWARSVADNPLKARDERTLAYSLVGTLEGVKRLETDTSGGFWSRICRFIGRK